MAHDINALPVMICQGNQGESNVTTIEFDVADWLDEYPTGAIGVHVIRPGEDEEDAYAAAGAALNGDTQEWTITSSDTAIEGIGRAVISLSVPGVEEGEDEVKKSNKFKTVVREGIIAVADIPEAIDDWMVRADQAIAEAESAVDDFNEWVAGISFSINNNAELEVTI